MAVAVENTASFVSTLESQPMARRVPLYCTFFFSERLVGDNYYVILDCSHHKGDLDLPLRDYHWVVRGKSRLFSSLTAMDHDVN